jgi:hypothetical protein
LSTISAELGGKNADSSRPGNTPLHRLDKGAESRPRAKAKLPYKKDWKSVLYLLMVVIGIAAAVMLGMR